ncbi:hypothetical protein H9638_02305 [Arthrobacter sp. Sa2BUA2]|uniref:Uncharacterized protein n=1 Tax=Arthrobacter pullicola TaxID=2762224 RepID=A0ABR8YEI2_9MICC|nr:hypothetical protein [Arthrobacter pullicola]MBD8042637.1 hypothetical protein [Arthrobacter pullicola]
MSRDTRVRSNKPDLLVLWVLILTFLPILFVVLFSLVTFASSIAGSGAVWSQVATSLPFLAAALAAVVTGVLMKRAATDRRAWALSVCTVVLLLVAASAPVISFSKAAAEEFCESAPGGRGYAETAAPEETPGICGWARN